MAVRGGYPVVVRLEPVRVYQRAAEPELGSARLGRRAGVVLDV